MISQPMVSRFINKITGVIVNHITPKYIRFPRNQEEQTLTKNKFLRAYGMPGILGVVDGTHVGVAALPHNIEAAFVNRKGFHSINVQIVCNSDLIITNVNARYPGSTHDAFVFNNSRLYTLLEDLNHEYPNEWNWLIGNAEYTDFCINNLLMSTLNIDVL